MSRHLIDQSLYADIVRISRLLGYKVRGADGWQACIKRLIAYAELHPELFRR